MQISVLVERIDGNGYQAQASPPLALCGAGATRDEALAELKMQCEAKLLQGAEILVLEVGPSAHPWLKFAGMFKDDPWIEDWKRSVEEYRQKVDEDPAAL